MPVQPLRFAAGMCSPHSTAIEGKTHIALVYGVKEILGKHAGNHRFEQEPLSSVLCLGLWCLEGCIGKGPGVTQRRGLRATTSCWTTAELCQTKHSKPETLWRSLGNSGLRASGMVEETASVLG